jgi:hypothetical protein
MTASGGLRQLSRRRTSPGGACWKALVPSRKSFESSRSSCIALVRPIAAATRADAPPSGINSILVNANRK